MKIAFYAPMKAPDHPTPSGDRRMARLFMDALRLAGHQVDLASRLRVYDGAGDPALQASLTAQAGAEVERILKGPRPDLWFTYHVYHKTPDLIGPPVAARLGLPYVMAEASLAPKRRAGPWAPFQAKAEAAVAQAAAIFCLTGLDMACLKGVAAEGALVRLPPFLDPAPFDAGPACVAVAGPVRLLAVGMMRSGDKLESYTQLAAALALVAGDWTLTIVGDGPARPALQALFRRFGDRITYIGMIGESALPAIYAAADIYVWPAVNEAFGMALLEAQAAGVPVVAGRVRGVPEVVWDGDTALLVPPDDAAAFAAAVSRLIAEPALRRAFGAEAARRVRRERSLVQAAERLDRVLRGLVA